MANNDIDIRVSGLNEWVAALKRAPTEMNEGLADAATLVGDEILNTPGLRIYPPSGPGNAPPPPYWVRGVGMQVYARGSRLVKKGTQAIARIMGQDISARESFSSRGSMAVRNTRNLHNSEKLGSKFYTLGEVSGMGAVIRIGNIASYAGPVIGEDQAQAMAEIGWRKLIEVARQKANNGTLGKIVEKVIDAALKRAGLR